MTLQLLLFFWKKSLYSALRTRPGLQLEIRWLDLSRQQVPLAQGAAVGADGACVEMRGCLVRASVTSCLCKCSQVPSRGSLQPFHPGQPMPCLAWGCKMGCSPNHSLEWVTCALYHSYNNKRVAEAIFWKLLMHYSPFLLQVHEPCPVWLMWSWESSRRNSKRKMR